MAGEHPFDGVAKELLGWLDSESTWVADAMKGGYTAPFGAEVTEKQKRDYYARKMFKTAPDGSIQYDTPNEQGRGELMTHLGVQGYAQVYESVRPKEGRRPTPEAEDNFEEEGEGYV